MNYNEHTLAEIVTENPNAISVFEKAGLDYCCNGNRNFETACEAAGLNPESISHQIEMEASYYTILNPATLPLDELTDYIFKRHHQYLERITPTIEALLEKVCRRHGHQHPELNELKSVFQQSAGELAVHMKKEEFMLFPFIRNMVQGAKVSRSVEMPILKMEEDHEHEGMTLKHLAELTNNFSAPPGACNSFVSLYKLLAEYVKDVHEHIHLENNVLFPGALALEKG